MGEYADYMLNGDDCEGCGEYLGNGPGYPRLCASCRKDKVSRGPKCEPAPKGKPFACPTCGKKLSTSQGLIDHSRVKHGAAA